MGLSKAYDPHKHEADIYKLWEQGRGFEPKNRGGERSYSIVMPPPNANANLHIGYELTAVLEDIPARYHRMRGDATLLLPGADHAGFETQVVYEKHLAKEGKSRFDFTREELYRQIWNFVAQNRDSFETQLRKMGVSADWSRFAFTLDEKIVKTAYQTFKKMWDEGLIYRGERLVNFCTFHGTAFADIEVAYEEQKGHLWHIRYPLTDGSGEVVVATTRPETMLGDTAVMVHPDDTRYKNAVGKTVKLPLTHREIPVVADQFVDTKFGTGAVKVTPAHDPNDFEVAERHDLPKISIIDYEGKLTHEAGEAYRGLTVKEARAKVAADLKEQGFLVKVEDYTHSVGHCYKCGTVIEPLLKDQWFIDMKPLAEKAIAALKAGEIRFYPEAKKDQLIKYLEGLKDWNISRQIAWGIPIPAFQNLADPDDWIYDERVDEEELVVKGKTYRRDPDVFDTWFSSSSWPYATLDYPDGVDYEKFYPLSLMETGGEILYPWVSRMIMLGLYVTGKVPFESVYIHGYVMAEDGAKMSKSIGNVVDPMPVIDQYGSDALRMGIIAGRVPAVNRGYDHRRVEEARNFANKLWNIARFIEDKIGDHKPAENPQPKTIADHWVLTNLQHLTEAVSADLDNYRFAEAYERLYHGVWDNVADWYIESSKVEPNPDILAYVLQTILKLLHPFAPFVTEAIWQELGWTDGLLITSPWPKVEAGDKQKTKEFEQIKKLVSEIRYFAKEMGLGRPKLLQVNEPLIEQNEPLIKQLAHISSSQNVQSPSGFELVQSGLKVWLEVDEKTLKDYKDKLDREVAELKTQVEQLKKRLSNKSYLAKAPKELVAQSKQQLAETEESLEKLLATR